MNRTKNDILHLGFGLYWAWVYLSFNSLKITGSMPDGAPFIPLLHIVSGSAGCLVFMLAIVFHNRIERSSHFGAAIWMLSGVTTLGTMFYTLPLMGETIGLVLAGAIVSGTGSPWIALAWGLAYCRLDAKLSTRLTAGSFLVGAGVFMLVSYVPQPVCGALVSFLPMLSTFLLYLCGPFDFTHPVADGDEPEPVLRELKSLFTETGNGRIVLGILLTMFVCGGLRVYIMQLQSDVYSVPFLVALPIASVALVFLGYSASVSRTSLNLGPFYRIVMPLIALGFVIIAMFGSGNTGMSFLIVSAGTALVDMITWVLLIELVRSTHFPALLILATGRCAIHLGMALGEGVALLMFESMTMFFIVSIILLMVAAGYMFIDRDTTFLFEPPTESEISETGGGGSDLDSRISSIATQYGLSPRETEVFTLWATGHGSKAIEERLVVSSSTVKTHLRHIYDKCDVHSRAEILELLEQAR